MRTRRLIVRTVLALAALASLLAAGIGTWPKGP